MRRTPHSPQAVRQASAIAPTISQPARQWSLPPLAVTRGIQKLLRVVAPPSRWARSTDCTNTDQAPGAENLPLGLPARPEPTAASDGLDLAGDGRGGRLDPGGGGDGAGADDDGLERGVWFHIRQGIRGLLVPDEHGREAVYLICEPASHYYRVMTRSRWMPVLIAQRV